METHNKASKNMPGRKFFLSPIAPSDELYTKIVGRIKTLELRALFIRRASLACVSILSLAGLIPSLSYLIGAFATSSFRQYLSLIASDGDIMLLNWKEFAFSLVESLPLMGITLVSIMIFGLIYSITSLIDQTPARSTLQLA